MQEIFLDLPQPLPNKSCWKWNFGIFHQAGREAAASSRPSSTSTQNKEECGILAMNVIGTYYVDICCQRVVGIDKKYHPKSVKAPFFTLLCSHLTDLKQPVKQSATTSTQANGRTGGLLERIWGSNQSARRFQTQHSLFEFSID